MTADFGFVPRAALPSGAWDAFVRERPWGWWFHTSAWLEYSLAYAPGSRDASVAAVLGGRIVAALPFVIGSDGRQTHGGQVTPAPLLDSAVVSSVTGDDWNDASSQMWRPGQVPEGGVPVSHVLAETVTHVVDLSRGREAVWAGLRKSYKPLIHKAEREFEIASLSAAPEEACVRAIEVARDVHYTAAGRRTRSAETWAMQARWMHQGYGVLATASRGLDVYGFAYGVRFKDWAYYCSGATLQKNLSHALVWQLMQHMQSDAGYRTRYFEVGHDAETDDEKAKSIAFFKAGFGGERVPVRMLVPGRLS